MEVVIRILGFAIFFWLGAGKFATGGIQEGAVVDVQVWDLLSWYRNGTVITFVSVVEILLAWAFLAGRKPLFVGFGAVVLGFGFGCLVILELTHPVPPKACGCLPGVPATISLRLAVSSVIVVLGAGRILTGQATQSRFGD